MRVLHVSRPVDGGVAEVVLALAADQRGRGWDTRIACPPGALADRASAAGIPVRTWHATRGPGTSLAAETRTLARLIDAVDPDVVHLHSSKAGLAGRLAVRGRRPTLFQPHAWSFDAVAGPTATAARSWERFAVRWTDRLVCVSQDELRVGRDAGIRGPAVVIPNGVDTERFAPRPAERARTALGLSTTRPIALCIGRVTEQKGQDLLLQAWPKVLAELPDAALLVVGDGDRAAQWRQDHPADSVYWYPATDDPAPWYEAANLVVLPSRWEGMPLVALEALASGRPVVGFGVTGVAEAVGEAGAIVRAEDTDGLAQAITERLRSGGPARAEGTAGRARALELFDRQRVAAATASAAVEVRDGFRGRTERS